MKVVDLYLAYHCVSQPHKGDLTAKLKYRRFSSYFLCILLLFPFHLLPSPVHLTGFSYVSSLASLPISPCCHRTTYRSWFWKHYMENLIQIECSYFSSIFLQLPNSILHSFCIFFFTKACWVKGIFSFVFSRIG